MSPINQYIINSSIYNLLFPIRFHLLPFYQFPNTPLYILSKAFSQVLYIVQIYNFPFVVKIYCTSCLKTKILSSSFVSKSSCISVNDLSNFTLCFCFIIFSYFLLHTHNNSTPQSLLQ